MSNTNKESLKVCSKCKKNKPTEGYLFWRGKESTICGDCREQYKRWASKNKEQRATYLNTRYKKKRKEIAKYNKEWRKKNPDWQKKWYSENREEIRAQRRIYEQHQRDTNLQARLAKRLRSGLSQALRHYGAGNKTRTASAVLLLGCTLDEFKQHLEKQFAPGMTWENHTIGGWHIDHIQPCCSFDLTDPEQQKACFHYTNLRPLWGKENQRKGIRSDKQLKSLSKKH